MSFILERGRGSRFRSRPALLNEHEKAPRWQSSGAFDLQREDSGFAEGASLHDAYAFADRDKLTSGKCRILLDEPEGPMDLNVGGCRNAEAKVQTGIARSSSRRVQGPFDLLLIAATILWDRRHRPA